MNRWMRFYFVGALGIAIQLSCLHLLRSADISYMISTALGVEAAVIHNFLWHHAWTWKDRQGSFLKRLLSFHLTNGCFSILGNLLFVRIFVELANMPVLLANLSAIGACSILNFLAADRIVFATELNSAE